MPVFPGDVEFGLRASRRIRDGDRYNLSRITLGTHAGTHIDPPLHFIDGGAAVDEVDLGAMNGPCRVWPVPDRVASITARELSGVPGGTERVLLKTSNSARWNASRAFFPEYVALDDSAAQYLVESGVRLVGIDGLSIESDPSERFPVHHRLLSAGVLILEGLELFGVPPGDYELRCLPLRLRGGDGGPARALLGRL